MTDERSSEATPNRDAYFGDLHVHTAYSLDAFLVGAANNPDAAYEFGKGEAKPLIAGRADDATHGTLGLHGRYGSFGVDGRDRHHPRF